MVHPTKKQKRGSSSSSSSSSSSIETSYTVKASSSSSSCPTKQHQLPLFLSKTYHMIDRCDPTISTWSIAGDNFVVKDVEKFASEVLPLYFKHSNFSSFARQLNFYGFRKLRSDPILTNDIDPQTSCYVRFYHEKFQKDHPELLQTIKRATKASDQQSKEDVDTLKLEVYKLKNLVTEMEVGMERKISDMTYDYNRRITSLTTECDRLANLVK
ncbi:winged helix DNA-binding domain-containing protein, partial [Fragilariopsis cylindrus CCMP1102]